MTHILTGDTLISRLEGEVKRRGDELAAFGNLPRLAIVVVGEDPSIRARARARVKYGAELGMSVEVHELPTLTSLSSLLKVIRRLSGDSEVDGILVEVPLPEHLAGQPILEEMRWEKDVSGFHPINLGKAITGQERTALLPVHVQACLMLFEEEKLAGRRIVIVTRESEIGRVLALLLSSREAVTTLCPSDAPDCKAVCQNADIVILAVNKTGFLHADLFSKDTVVIDVGQNLTEHGWVGDLEGIDIGGKVKAFIPMQGGLERLTPVLLFRNLVAAAEKVRDSEYGR